MENWLAHPAVDKDVSEWILRLMPFLEQIHKKYHDPLFVDLTRVHLLFDDKRKPIEALWDERHPTWTQENPLPINSIGVSDEILTLWESPDIIFAQTKSEAQWMLNIAHEYNHLLVICQGVQTSTDEHNVATLTCYIVQKVVVKRIVNYTLATVPNSNYAWYCRYCSKKMIKKKRCPKCAPTIEQTDSLPGTYYCDAKCQTSDWARHKLECKPL